MEQELIFLGRYIPTEPPPPYSFEDETLYRSQTAPSATTLSRFGAYNYRQSVPSRLEAVLGNYEELNFLATRKSGLMSSGTIKVSVLDSNEQVLMSTVSEKKESGHSGSIISFVDNDGSKLLKLREVGNTIVVTGDRHFGHIEKAGSNIMTFPSKFEALNEFGDEMFLARRDAGDFKFIADGSTIAIARYRKMTQGKVCSIKFSRTLDFSTKAMLMATATFVDILFFPVNEY